MRDLVELCSADGKYIGDRILMHFTYDEYTRVHI